MKIKLLGAAGLIAIIIFLSSQLNIADIQSLVKRAGIWAPVVFILLHTSSYVVAPISGTPFWLAGYPLFGDQFIIYNYVSSLIGMVINFWISRKWGRRVVTKFVGGNSMAKIDEFSKQYGIKALVLLRLFQGNLADFISYAYGLTKISFSKYFLISALAPIPWALIWWFFLFPRIDSYREYLVGFFLAASPALIISIFLALYYRRKTKS